MSIWNIIYLSAIIVANQDVSNVSAQDDDNALQQVLWHPPACPRQCTCFVDVKFGRLVYCVFKQLMSVPKAIPLDTQTLYLASNEISIIGPNDFPRNLLELERLYLNTNKLTSIHASAFQNLGQLKFLDLANNNLTLLDRNLFKPLRKLERLYLEENNLVGFSAGTFGNQKNLQSLTLESNPFICCLLIKALESVYDKLVMYFDNYGYCMGPDQKEIGLHYLHRKRLNCPASNILDDVPKPCFKKQTITKSFNRLTVGLKDIKKGCYLRINYEIPKGTKARVLVRATRNNLLSCPNNGITIVKEDRNQKKEYCAGANAYMSKNFEIRISTDAKKWRKNDRIVILVWI